MRILRFALLALCLATPALAERPAQRFDDLGDHRRTITTSSEEAQAWFNQGIALYFNFNHEEAILSFQAAAEADRQLVFLRSRDRFVPGDERFGEQVVMIAEKAADMILENGAQ